MTQPDRLMREEFEAWARSQRMGLKKDGVVTSYAYERTDLAWQAWQASREAKTSPVWQGMETCPQHTEVLFYRGDAGVFSGMITDADHFLSNKERDEWEGTEEEMFDLDAFGFGDWGVCRCDGSERPTHWMPLPEEPKVKP